MVLQQQHFITPSRSFTYLVRKRKKKMIWKVKGLPAPWNNWKAKKVKELVCLIYLAVEDLKMPSTDAANVCTPKIACLLAFVTARKFVDVYCFTDSSSLSIALWMLYFWTSGVRLTESDNFLAFLMPRLQSPSSLGAGSCFFLLPITHRACTLHSPPVSRPRASHFVSKSKPTTFIFYFEQPWYAHFFSEFPCFPVCCAPLSSYFPAFLHLQQPLFSCLTYPPCSPLYLISLHPCLPCPLIF